MYMTVAYLSDKTQKRGIFCVIFGTVSLIGYAILISETPAGAHYFGYVILAEGFSAQHSHHNSCFLIASGLYILVGLPLAWLPNNSPRYGKRAAANGLQLTIGNASGIMAPFI